MSSEIIYKLIISKSNKTHHILRYIKFIESLKNQPKQKGLTEHHHILPKCKGMFPEYKSLYKHPWNGAHLTQRQHFIAHWMLHNIFGNTQTKAFWLMCKGKERIPSKLYESVKKEMSLMISELNKGNQHGKGYKMTLDRRQSISEKNKKITEFISPDGTVYIHKGFNEFCKLHNLNMPCMRRVVLGKRPHHKGWKCRYINNDYPEFKPCDPIQRAINASNGHKKVFYYQSPDGEIGSYKGIKDFCIQYKLNPDKIRHMMKTGTGDVKGWVCRIHPISPDQNVIST